MELIRWYFVLIERDFINKRELLLRKSIKNFYSYFLLPILGIYLNATSITQMISKKLFPAIAESLITSECEGYYENYI